jgi:hypothetical protein
VVRHCQPIFWLPNEGLANKARADRVPYGLWRDEGYLETTPESTVSTNLLPIVCAAYSSNIVSAK